MGVDMNEDDGLAPVEMTLQVPGRLVRDYEALARAGVYLSVEEGLRATLVTGWRYDKGTFHSIRLDLAGDREVSKDDGVEDDADAAEKA